MEQMAGLIVVRKMYTIDIQNQLMQSIHSLCKNPNTGFSWMWPGGQQYKQEVHDIVVVVGPKPPKEHDQVHHILFLKNVMDQC